MQLRKIIKFNLRRILVEKGYGPTGTVMADLLGSTKQFWGKILDDDNRAGIGTLFLFLITWGFWLLAMIFYPKRCIVCGLAKSELKMEKKHRSFRLTT